MKVSSELLEKLVLRTLEYLIKDISLDAVNDKFEIEDFKTIELLEVSSQISLSGYLSGTVVISTSEAFAVELAKKSIFGDLELNGLKELAGENLAEILNIVLGNILQHLDGVKEGKVIEISAPKVYKGCYRLIKNEELKVCILSCKNEKLILGYFI